MTNVKEKFDLLKNVPNILNMSISEVKQNSIELGHRKIFVNLEQVKGRINHYTKNRIFEMVSNIKTRENQFHVLYLPGYPLPISYNKPTKAFVINVGALGIDDIQPDNPGVYNLYALMVYGIMLSDITSGKIKLPEKYSSVISSFILSLFMRLFGKVYGLTGSFSTQIPKMEFLINVYILNSFYGISGLESYKKAAVASSFNYKDIEENLKSYNFSNINDFIKALSDFDVMPNINRYVFAQKMQRFFNINMLAALEDCARFFSVLTTSSIKGSNIVSTYLYKYNEREFSRLLEVSKAIFKRS
jgi:hypothetical protein